MCRVLDDDETVALGKRQDGAHIARASIQVDRNDRAGARRDRRRGLLDIDEPSLPVAVDQNRCRATVNDGVDGRWEGHRRRDDFITGSHARNQ